jgi:hypothetical protein
VTSIAARRVILPHYSETITCHESDIGAVEVALGNGNKYFCRPLSSTRDAGRADRCFAQERSEFDRYPIILSSDGAPWYEANMWILHKLRESGHRSSTRDIASSVDDLVAYLRFLEESNISWMDFSSTFKEARPTYRFQTELSDLVCRKVISHSVGKRRLGTIIRFYRWLTSSAQFKPLRPPWVNKEIRLLVPSRHGFTVAVPIVTTDLKVKGEPKPDPFDTRIADGGKLRPLPQMEQIWLMDALLNHGNYELQLMHWLAISTGARIQTVLTLRRTHVWRSLEINSPWNRASVSKHKQMPHGFVAIDVGPGTGIDTKFGQNYPLYVPTWLYEKLHIYAHSQAGTRRREMASGGDIDEQYLFLTKRKQPWYSSIQAGPALSATHSNRRSHIVGGAVGTLIREKIIPQIRAMHDPQFQYSFHDLRATFGMNEIDRLLDKPKDPKNINGPRWTLTDVLKWVMARLHHSRMSVTEGYLIFRDNMGLARAAQEAWEDELSARMKQQANIAEKRFLRIDPTVAE